MSDNKMLKNWCIQFEKAGATASDQVLDNEIWLDLGNKLCMGCVDHHHVSGHESALSALIHNLSFLDHIKEFYKNNKDRELIVHLHTSPDMDCVASFYAVNYYLLHANESDDAFEKRFGENGYAKRFVSYVDAVDAGYKKVLSAPTLYACFYALFHDEEAGEGREKDLYVLEKGFEYLDKIMDALEKEASGANTMWDQPLDLANASVVDILAADKDENFKEEFSKKALLIKEIYENEKSNGLISFKEINIWNQSKEVEKIKAAIWKDVSKDSLTFNLAREEGYPLTIAPSDIKGKDDSPYTKLIVSIDPEKNRKDENDPNSKKDKYTIRPFVEIIELLEQMEENKLYDLEGVYRRDHSRARDSEEDHFLAAFPFSVTADPWYMKPEEDLIAAPGAKSLLEYKDIVSLIERNGSALKRSYGVTISGAALDGRNALTDMGLKSNVPISDWQDQVKSLINKNGEDFQVVFAEVDSSLIVCQNNILKAICMNLIGRSMYDCKDENFLFLDYKTCIYADINCMIIMVATHRAEDYQSMTIQPVLDISGIDKFMESALIVDAKKVVSQYRDLVFFSNQIGDSKSSDRKNIEKMNADLLAFSAKAQKDDMVTDSVEREIYYFLKGKFKIDELKSTVLEETSLLVNESREQLVSKFNALSSFAVPFVLVATVFQMGVLSFDNIWEISGKVPSLIAWILCFILIVAMMIFIAKMGHKKK